MNYTPEQQRAIETTGAHLCVDAGAGSGKTRVLVDRMIHLLDRRAASLDEIVAITFTDKAAAEMKERLRRECRKKAPPGDDTTPEQMNYWRDLERRVDEARVMTIHAFCAGLLREHALRSGIDPDFRLLDETESQSIRERVARETLEARLPDDETAMRAAVAFGFGPLTEMMAKLLNQSTTMSGVVLETPQTPEEIVARWKTVCEEVFKTRIRALASSPEVAAFAAALAEFDGACALPSDTREHGRQLMLRLLDLLRAEGSLPEIERVLSEVSALDFRKGVSKKNWLDPELIKELSPIQKKVREWAKKLERDPFDEEQSLRSAGLTLDVVYVYQAIAEAYAGEKASLQCMDFEDLISGCLALLERDGDVRAQVAAGIRHLLVDEFQDTDRDQLSIARLLRRAGEQAGGELFIVGDPKQSIYNFRGAEVGVFAEARTESDETISLATNFRSAPNVLEFVNDFFGNAAPMQGEGVEFRALEAFRDALDGPCVEFLVPSFDDKPNADEGRRGEARLIAGRVYELCNGSEIIDPEKGTSRPARYGDCAILFRTSTGLHLYEDALRRRGIPFHTVTGGGFYDRQEVRDLSNLLKSLTDDRDEMALFGFLRGPLVALKDESIVALAESRKLRDAFWSDTGLADTAQHERLLRGRELLNELRGYLGAPLQELLRAAIRLSAFEAILLGGPHGVQRVGNLRKVIDLAGRYSGAAVPSLPSFIRFLDQAAHREFREGDAPLFTGATGAVTLLTTHKAKGLEFPIVVLADLGHGTMAPRDIGGVRVHRRLGIASTYTGADGKRVSPAIISALKDAQALAEDAEEARVLYVAMTRARDRLLLGCGPATGTGWAWTTRLDAAYNLAASGDGDVVQGEGWTGVVRTTTEVSDGKTASDEGAAALPDIDALVRMAAPVSREFSATTIPVSAVVTSEESGDKTHGEPASPLAVDPRLRGTVTHAFFEAWDFRGDAPDVERFVLRQCRAYTQRADLCTSLRQTAERFVASELYARLRDADSLRRELPFLLRLEDVYLSGTIDVLVDDMLIVDYKTGRKNSARGERYAMQLALYAAALELITGTRPREAVVYYVDSGEVVDVDTGDAAVVAALERARHVMTARAGV